jgi:hypothetical protein
MRHELDQVFDKYVMVVDPESLCLAWDTQHEFEKLAEVDRADEDQYLFATAFCILEVAELKASIVGKSIAQMAFPVGATRVTR